MRLIEAEIRELKHKVLDMAELVLLQLEDVIHAVHHYDVDTARKIRKNEKKVDKYDIKIDRRCERILALYQPVANDLRFVTSVLKINAFLEQIGDIINGIARKLMEIGHDLDIELLTRLRLQDMTQLTRKIVNESLMAFFRENLNQAKSVFIQDDEIDTIHRDAFNIITERIQQNPAQTAELIQLLLIIKSLEKIADFAVCIAEEAIFHVEGIMYRHNELKFLYRDVGGEQSAYAIAT
jgi:phosphate transport system protein